MKIALSDEEFNYIKQKEHDMVAVLNQVYLYAKVNHTDVRDYQVLIERFIKKYPQLTLKITGML